MPCPRARGRSGGRCVDPMPWLFSTSRIRRRALASRPGFPRKVNMSVMLDPVRTRSDVDMNSTGEEVGHKVDLWRQKKPRPANFEPVQAR